MNDRLTNIKDGSFTAGDVFWLVSEVERLHTQTSAIRSRLAKAMPGQTFDADSLFVLLDAVLYQRRGAMIELGEIHDVLAEALGYTQDAPDDDASPCPGAWVTGDHTAASLALEAARKLKGQEATIHALGRSVDRARDSNNTLELRLRRTQENYHQTHTALRTAADQIIDLQRKVSIAEKTNTKKYVRKLERTVAAMQRELAARKLRCGCVFREDGEEGDRLMPHPECSEHGVEANDRRLAGEKALNTLMYVRKYFMGSEHGHEV
jgi:hypothetical protein